MSLPFTALAHIGQDTILPISLDVFLRTGYAAGFSDLAQQLSKMVGVVGDVSVLVGGLDALSGKLGWETRRGSRIEVLFHRHSCLTS